MNDRDRSLQAAGACAVITLVCVFLFWPLLACRGACTIDVDAWTAADPQFTELAKADVRLNTWILAWVQHALLDQPTRVFDANVFHPAARTLAGSEHMLSVAVVTAPLRIFSSNATALYNLATVLSFLIAGLSTYAFVAWLTRDRPIALGMGIAAMLMPWRWSELDHLQLLFAAWLPAAWLLIARSLLERADGRRLVALGAVWAALVFSSYYVAYFACFTTAAFIITLVVADRGARSRAGAVALALAVPLILLAAFSLPYLEARDEAELVRARNTLLSVPPSLLWATLRPTHLLLREPTLPYTAAYSLPALLAVVACCGVLPVRQAGATPADAAHARVTVVALLAACALALVMALGQHLDVSGVQIPLPASWAALIVPGFDFVRVPMRWAIVAGTALPVLAGAGLRALAAMLAGVMARRASVAIALLLLIVLAPLVPPRLPVAAAYPSSAADEALYRALTELPPGPVLEVPWPRRPEANVATSSAYMVASTRGWWPLLNGYTAYKPRTYDFLVRAGATLPARTAVERLNALTGVRWIVVHLDRLAEGERDTWAAAQMHGPLAPAYQTNDAVIYEVVGWERGGGRRERLDTTKRFATTIGGLPRTPLHVDSAAGRLVATLPVVVNRYQDGWASQSIPVRIINDTKEPWPGIDPDPNGLVHVRYALSDANGTVVLEDTAALDEDVPANGALTTNVIVQGSLDPGTLGLRLELVQRIGDRFEPIGALPVEGEARVVPLAARSSLAVSR